MRMFFTKTLSLFALLHFLIYASLVAHVACGPSTPSTGTGDTGGTKASKNVKLDCPEIKALNTSGHWNKERYFIEPLLHECLRRNPVDISQLPAIPGAKFSPLKLEFDFNFNSLVKFDNDGTFRMKAYMKFNWYDQQRTWDASEYGINQIFLPSHEIWTPTFELENCQEDNCFFRRHNQTKVTLESDGFVYFGIQVLVSANIDMELNMFPRDVQTVSLTFTLKDLGPKQVKIVESDYMESTIRFENEEWQFLGLSDTAAEFNYTKTKRVAKKGGEEKMVQEVEQATGFNVTIRFRRHPLYYVFNMIVPVIIMSIIGLFSMFLPAGSGDKCGLIIMVFLGFLVFQTSVASNSPKSDKSPYLAKYILWSLVLAALNLAACTVIMAVFGLGESDSGPKRRALEASVVRPVVHALRWLSPGFLFGKLPICKGNVNADERSGERSGSAEKDNGIEAKANPRQTATAYSPAIELEAITPLSEEKEAEEKKAEADAEEKKQETEEESEKVKIYHELAEALNSISIILSVCAQIFIFLYYLLPITID